MLVREYPWIVRIFWIWDGMCVARQACVNVVSGHLPGGSYFTCNGEQLVTQLRDAYDANNTRRRVLIRQRNVSRDCVANVRVLVVLLSRYYGTLYDRTNTPARVRVRALVRKQMNLPWLCKTLQTPVVVLHIRDCKRCTRTREKMEWRRESVLKRCEHQFRGYSSARSDQINSCDSNIGIKRPLYSGCQRSTT